MLICGLKLTHDGGIALVNDSRIVFSIEMEKLSDCHRHARLDDLASVERVLEIEGFTPDDIDALVVDGWHAGPDGQSRVDVRSQVGELSLPTAPYQESPGGDPAASFHFDGLPLAGRSLSYNSYHHAAGHLFSAYATGPAAAEGRPSLVLVWDAGMLPTLYEVSPGKVRKRAVLASLFGDAFTEFSRRFDPYRAQYEAELRKFGKEWPFAIAGKAMAYAGLGKPVPELFPLMQRVLDDIGPMTVGAGGVLADQLIAERDRLCPGLSDADLISTFQDFLGEMLVRSLIRVVERFFPHQAPDLCLSGGCALNIKWNSAIRRSGVFRTVWVPPFPNDSGSAIGTALAHQAARGGGHTVDWTPYAGPVLEEARPLPGWTSRPCTPQELACLLADTGAPVVVLHGRAELGPRALGNRSILAPAVEAGTKDRLNGIKEREPYRPVAPVCLEHRAPDIFDPGTHDPYMLFEHRIRPAWRDRIPAVLHLDGTARLQTVTSEQNPLIAEVLEHYDALTGIPVLCNTSANHKGRGFFPSIASAMRWAGTSYVWSEGILHTAPDAPPPAGDRAVEVTSPKR
ncbi:beta-1,4-N-acetylglucosamine oligosaccharide 6-O-carbamoyltransferase NodU [Nocardiopsis sp. Huas11]|nr:beta-1,4-N-acetylglucosamine oligosaccharide 6-O-carbamoyltransferase NodU [Nocardiopsis sp. Huas11]